MEAPSPSSGIDVVCAGEAMAMFVPEHVGPLTGDTLYRISAAGAEANVARYLARLGVRSAWVSRVGTDPFGDFVAKEVGRDGVDVSRVERDDDRATGVAFKQRGEAGTDVYYYRRRSAASALGPEAAAAAWGLNPQVLHLSGITPALSEDCREFIATALRTRPLHAKVSFDVNWRPALWSESDPGVLHHIAQASDIVFVGLDEAQEVWGLSEIEAIRSAVDAPPVLIVKRGAAGCTVFEGERRIDVPALDVDVLEPVGAGDAFAAGFLYAHLAGFDAKQAARMGTVIASSALSVHTDVGAMPDPHHVDHLLALEDDDWRLARYEPWQKLRNRPDVPNC